MIVSFLTLRTRELPSEIKEILNSAIGRVQAVALAHDQLSGSNSASTLLFDEYLRPLCSTPQPLRFSPTIPWAASPARLRGYGTGTRQHPGGWKTTLAAGR